MQEIQTNIVKQLSEQMQEFRLEAKVNAESTNKKIDAVCEKIEKTQYRLTKVEQEIQEMKAERVEIQARLTTLEMEKASYFLRIQNVAQLEGETEDDWQEFTQAVERIF